MEYPHDADATQVAHLFLKAADQGVIKSEEATSALRILFPDLFAPEDGELAQLVDELLDAADRAMDVRLSLRLKSALESLRFYGTAKTTSG